MALFLEKVIVYKKCIKQKKRNLNLNILILILRRRLVFVAKDNHIDRLVNFVTL
jgi:hypothetical protein